MSGEDDNRKSILDSTENQYGVTLGEAKGKYHTSEENIVFYPARPRLRQALQETRRNRHSRNSSERI